MNSYLIKQMITGPAEPYRTELLTEIGHDGSFSSQNSLCLDEASGGQFR